MKTRSCVVLLSLVLLLSGCQPSLASASVSGSMSPSDSVSGYALTLAEAVSGVSLAFPSQAQAQEKVTVKATSEDGSKTVDHLLANGVQLSGDADSDYSFLMPASPVVLTLTVKDVTHTVRFYNYDNTLLDTQTVVYNQTAVYAGKTPTRRNNRNGNFVFQGWDKPLTSITADEDVYALYSVEALSDYLFAPTKDADGNDAYLLSSYAGEQSEITLPQMYLGYPVIGIEPFAFYPAKNLSQVTVPDSYVSLAKYAFAKQTTLTSVSGLNKVTAIGDWAFSDCPKLVSVSLAEGLVTLGDCAFRASGLTSLILPSTLTSMPSYLFYEDTSLKSVTLPDTWTKLPDQLFNGASSLENFNWPSQLTAIGNGVFDGAGKITELVIPDAVTSIGYWALSQMPSLTKLTIGNGVTKLLQYTCTEDTALVDLTLPESLTDFSYTDIFAGDSALKKVSLPSKITSLGSDAFARCTALTEVTFGSDFAKFGSADFAYCTSLVSFTLPTKVTSLPDKLFFKDSQLSDLDLSQVTSIGAGSLTGLSSYTLGTNTHYVETEGALYSADGKTLVDVTNTAQETYQIPATVTTLSGYAFCGRNLPDLVIPSSVTRISSYAFSGLLGATSVTLPSSVTSLGNAFSDRGLDSKDILTSDVTTVTLLCQVSMLMNLFDTASNIKDVRVLGEKVATLNYNFLRQLPNLESLTLPVSVTKIARGALPNSQTIDVYYEGNAIDWSLINLGENYTNLWLHYGTDLSSLK